MTAACLVIYSHGFVLSPQYGQADLITTFLKNESSGSVAVKTFFFLSGLVVTNSLLLKRDPLQFIIARFFRIWPALFVTLIVTVFVVGPIFTTFPLPNYFGASHTYKYLIYNLQMNTVFTLPGVFDANAYPASVNGSLWTIRYEIIAYLILLAFFCLGGFRIKILPLMAGILVILDPILFNGSIYNFFAGHKDADFNMACFAFGSILATYKDRISINFWTVICSFVLYLVLQRFDSHHFLFFFFIFLSIIFFASTQLFLKIKLPVDISYGIYLWAFIIQQMLGDLFPGSSVLFNQTVSLIFSLILGLLSWYVVEKPCILIGSRVAKISNLKLNYSISFLKSKLSKRPKE